MAVVEPQATPLIAATPTSSPMLRSEDGGVSHAPAFLQARPEPKAPEAVAEDAEARPARTRRRRAPRSFEAAEGEAPATASGAAEDA